MSSLTMITLFSLIAATLCQELVPPDYTWIRWGDVKGDHFRVRWSNVDNARGYNVFVYEGRQTDNPMEVMYNVTETSCIVGGLKLYTVYGVRVQCISPEGKTSPQGRPARTWTFGRTTTTTSAPPTAPTPVGSCGMGKFTCETNDECVPEGMWCDKDMDCADGSDEKNCPGSCTEITEFSEYGNFSCNRWNSPESVCFFQCNGDYVRDGAYYFMCKNGQWALEKPTCRLRRPWPTVVRDLTTENTVVVRVKNIESAAGYEISYLKDVEQDTEVEGTLKAEEVDEQVFLTIGNLKSGTVYEARVAYVNDKGAVGKPSWTFKVTTERTPKK